jgi:hypothetical protein
MPVRPATTEMLSLGILEHYHQDDRGPHSINIYGPGIPGPYMYVITPALSTRSDFSVAIAAIDWPATGRRKRHFGVFAALGACRRKHLS